MWSGKNAAIKPCYQLRLFGLFGGTNIITGIQEVSRMNQESWNKLKEFIKSKRDYDLNPDYLFEIYNEIVDYMESLEDTEN